MKVALIGADGQLGSDLQEILDKESTASLYYPEFDVTNAEQVEDVLTRLNPDSVINTAAFNRVDDCEVSPLEAFRINTVAVRDLARVCTKIGAVLVHFSSDYVFDGEKDEPYTEQDTPHPLSIYGLSKMAGEVLLVNETYQFFLIRTCGLYGKAGCWGKGKNFVDSMVDAASRNAPIHVVCDQTVTPTATSELAQRVVELISTNLYGVYHMTNEGQCTWFEFAREIFKLLRAKVNLVPVDSQTYGARARRPAYSVLSSQKANRSGINPFSQWQDALKMYLTEKGHID